MQVEQSSPSKVNLQLLVGCNQTKPEGMELLKRIEEFKSEWKELMGIYSFIEEADKLL